VFFNCLTAMDSHKRADSLIRLASVRRPPFCF